MRQRHPLPYIFIFLLVLTAATTACQAAASAGSVMSVDDYTYLTITMLDPTGMQFGTIMPKGGGTVTVTADGTRTSSGVQVIPNSPCTPAHMLVGGCLLYTSPSPRD